MRWCWNGWDLLIFALLCRKAIEEIHKVPWSGSSPKEINSWGWQRWKRLLNWCMSTHVTLGKMVIVWFPSEVQSFLVRLAVPQDSEKPVSPLSSAVCYTLPSSRDCCESHCVMLEPSSSSFQLVTTTVMGWLGCSRTLLPFEDCSKVAVVLEAVKLMNFLGQTLL